jgi:hypothetical protein
MIDEQRFNTPHSSLYLIGVIFITGLFVFNKITALCSPSHTGLFEVFIKLCMKCCVKDNQEPPQFSADIYADVTLESLRQEYKDVKRKVQEQTLDRRSSKKLKRATLRSQNSGV